VPPGATPVPVNLTAGATGGPFTDADVVDVEPASAGTASISGGKVAALGPTTPGFYLIFKPSKTFSGKAVVHFTLSSALGTSAPASVTYAITADPAQVSEAVSGLVHDFVSARQSLLANGIDAPGLLRRRAMEGGQQPGIVSMQPDGNTLTLNFASSLAEMRAWNAAADAAEGLATSDEPLPFNFWIDGTASLHVRDTDGDDHWGRFALMSMGADYLVNDKFLAGVAIYTDFMDDLTDTSTVSGKGLLAGPYASLEVGDGVFVDGLLLYGHSWNSVEAGSFAGDFETERLLAKLKVEGQWQLSDALVLRPNATAFYLREKAGDYDVTDGAGTVVNVAGFTSEQLRLSVGGRLDYTMLLDSGMTLVPYLGLDLGLSARDGSDLTDNAFGKLAVGFTLMNDNSLRLTGEVQVGAQADGLRSVSAKLSLGAGF
jgi:outer membrane autotransporter protein